MRTWVGVFQPPEWARAYKDPTELVRLVPHVHGMRATDIRPGDHVLCYVTRRREWVGLLEAIRRPADAAHRRPVEFRVVALLALGEGSPASLPVWRYARNRQPLPTDVAEEIEASFNIRTAYAVAPGDWSGKRWDLQADEEGGGGSDYLHVVPPNLGDSGSAASYDGIEIRGVVGSVGDHALTDLASLLEVRRTPHLDAPKRALKPGTRFEVTVWADRSGPRSGEEVVEIIVLTSASEFTVSVKLVPSPHFELIDDEPVKQLLVRTLEKQTNAARFSLRVLEAPPTDGAPPSVAAHFWHGGQRCGSVMCRLKIAQQRRRRQAKLTSLPPASLVVREDHKDPDLLVSIEAASPEEDRDFHCTVISPHLKKYIKGASGTWKLESAARDLVSDYMQSFVERGASQAQRANRLRGAGNVFFRAAPKVFRDCYWALVEAGKEIETIAIVSQEPFMPWELMVPNRPGDTTKREPLGIAHRVGRWSDPSGVSAPQHLLVSDSYIVAPVYRALQNLANAKTEAAWVRDHFKGKLVTPATFDGLDACFAAAGVTLIHFVCHGGSQGSQLMLAANDNKSPEGSLRVLDLEDWPAAASAIGSKHPLVFLNACEVGRLEPSLIGIDGLAPAFARLGASCVIAPVWSVEDGAAHDVAQRFYEALLAQPAVPLAAIFQQIRRDAYKPDGADSYGAYCFFGDPDATATVG
jgi:hypothetical protein